MSSDEKALKPSERIKDIADGYVANYPEAIMIFLDEQYEKAEENRKNCFSWMCNCEKNHPNRDKEMSEGKLVSYENGMTVENMAGISKKPCLHCGTTYQDPKYCSVSGRTADKHVFEEKSIVIEKECEHHYCLNEPICCKCLEPSNQDQEVAKPVSERNANPDTLTATIIAREGEERLRLVRNALIDELIEEMNEMYDPDTRSNESRRGYDEAFSHFSNLLKSKKK